MPSAKRRLSQANALNAKVARTNMSLAGFFVRKEKVNDDDQTSECSPMPAKERPINVDEVSQSTSIQPDTPRKPKLNSGHASKFNPKWKISRPWLTCKAVLDDENEVETMLCSICQKWNVGTEGPWVKTGCSSLRLDSVVRHEGSIQHKTAVKQELTSTTTIDDMAKDMTSQEAKALVDAQKVLFFLIQHNLPHMTLFKPLVELCVELGATNLVHLQKGKNANYTAHRTVDEFLKCQAETVEEDVTEKVKESEAFGVMIDEYTDVSARKHLAVVAKHVNKGTTTLSFLQDIQLPNGTADSIYSSLKTYLETADISMANMTSFASDGPSVMVGKENGVVAQLKRDNPKVIPVHCMNHRLQLAVSRAFGSVKEIAFIDELLTGVWKYYHYSTVKSGSLEAIQNIMRELGQNENKNNLTVKKAVHTRWLSHENAVQSLRKLYLPICQDLEDAISSGRDKTNGEKTGPTAAGLLKLLKQFRNLYCILLLCDMCSTLSRLTLVFERADVDLSIVQPQIHSTVMTLQTMKKKPGPFLSKLKTMTESLSIEVKGEESVETARDKFIDALVDHLSERLDHSDLLNAMAVLDLHKIPQDQVHFHGDAELQQIGDHLGLPEDELMMEWMELKQTFSGDLERCTPGYMLTKLCEKRDTIGDTYPLLTRLLAVYESLILSTAPVERVFSQVKLIVTEHRNRLNIESTNRLLMIKMNTKNNSDINLEKVVKKFLMKKRRIM